MDHAVSAYSIRCHNKDAGRGKEDSYHYLDRIGGYDLFAMMQSFLEGKKEYVRFDNSKQVYKIKTKTIDNSKRIISGWIEYGHYGMESNIINITNNKTEFEKKTDNADIARYFFLFWIPKKARDGIAIFHTIRGDGVKSLFHKEFGGYLNLYSERSLQMNSMSFDKVLQEWANAETKEIVALRLKTPNDIADIPGNLGNIHTNFSIKPQKNNSLGLFRNFLKKNTPEANLVEELDNISDDVKVVLNLDGRVRSFRIGKKNRRGNTEVVVSEDVDLIGGVPEFKSMYNWVLTVLEDFKKKLY
ncbi:hypothetical protein V1481_01360 [Aeromonas enteropelogenes]|uniref:hypothetical protein n=1 Tax=Aeromonas enteropelogenes TaxID=29489 RepID=UPI003134A731